MKWTFLADVCAQTNEPRSCELSRGSLSRPLPQSLGFMTVDTSRWLSSVEYPYRSKKQASSWISKRERERERERERPCGGGWNRERVRHARCVTCHREPRRIYKRTPSYRIFTRTPSFLLFSLALTFSLQQGPSIQLASALAVAVVLLLLLHHYPAMTACAMLAPSAHNARRLLDVTKISRDSKFSQRYLRSSFLFKRIQLCF